MKKYSILSRVLPNDETPRGWKILGSNDNYNWHLIDEQGPDDNLAPRNESKLFQVKNIGIYRSIRWVQTANNTYNRQVAVLCKFEAFGTLFPNELCLSIKTFTFFSPIVFSSIFLLYS